MSFMLPAKRPLIMGIVNVTPDSFSGDGLLVHGEYVAAATEQAMRMTNEGADLIDVGGESSRPGAIPISIEEEVRRVVPVIKSLRKTVGAKLPIAVDTVKAGVAEAALDAGADIVNDISAMQKDPAMAVVVAQRGYHIILMHNRGNADAVTHDPGIGAEYEAAAYQNIVEDVKRD